MAKRLRRTDSDGTTPSSPTYRAIFIDTNIDTHLAVMVSDSDTVSNLKEKVLSEHVQCFPERGDMKIHSVEVEREGCFYHLPDYMLVKCAFEGLKNNWFLRIVMSSSKVHNGLQQLANPDVSKEQALLCIENPTHGHGLHNILSDGITPSGNHESTQGKVPDANGVDITEQVSKDIAIQAGCDVDAPSHDLSSAANRICKIDTIHARNEVSESDPGFKGDIAKGDVRNSECYTTGQSLKDVNPAKKRKSGRNDVAASSFASKYKNDLILASQPETITTANSTGDERVEKFVCLEGDHRKTGTIGKKKKKRMKETVHNHDQSDASVLSLGQAVKIDRSFEPAPQDVKCSKAEKNITEKEEISQDSDANISEEHTVSCIKMKKSARKSETATCQEASDMERADNQGTSQKIEEVCIESKEASKRKSSNPSLRSARRKADRTNENDDKSCPITQNAKAVEEGEMMDETVRNNTENDRSMGNTNMQDVPTKEQGIEIGNRDIKNAGNNNTTAKKRKKKVQGFGEKNDESQPTNDPIVDKETLNDRLNGVKTPLEDPGKEKAEAQPNEVGTGGQNLEGRSRKKSRKRQSTVADDHFSVPANDHCANAGSRSCQKSDKLNGDKDPLHPITQSTEEKRENMDETMRNNIENYQSLGNTNMQDVTTTEQGNDIGQRLLDEAPRVIENAEMNNMTAQKKKKKKKVQSSALKNHGIFLSNGPNVNEESRASKGVNTPSKEQVEEKAHVQESQMESGSKNTEIVETRSRRKTKKSCSAAVHGLSSVPMKDQLALGCVRDVAASNNRLEEADSSYKTPESLVDVPQAVDLSNNTQKFGFNTVKKAKKATGNSAADSHPKFLDKDQCVVLDTLASVHSSRELGPPSKAKNTGNYHVNQLGNSESDSQKNTVESYSAGAETGANACSITEGTRGEGEEISFKQYFVSSQHQSEVVTNLIAEATVEEKVAENGGNSDVTTCKLQPDLIKSSKDYGNVEIPSGETKSTSKVSKGMKTKKVEKHGVSHSFASSGLKETVPSHAKVNDKCLDSSSSTSSLEISKKNTLKKKDNKESGVRRDAVTRKGNAIKLSGEAAKSLEGKKSLWRTPVSIFKDVNGESSGDESGQVDSYPSTRTPSDNSSASGYSSDESESSTENGANGKGREGVTKRISKPELSGPKQIPMDVILRSSSRFKKAASQQFDEESETQQMEFVPESQDFN